MYIFFLHLYTKQIQAFIKTYSDRHGFVDYSATKHLSRAVGELTDEARLNLTKGQPPTAMFVALAIAVEIVQVINYGADDSNGEPGSYIEDAFEIPEAAA